ncbi:hypothetical protein ACFPPF_09835 [Xenophilus aerolatus]|nr:hypothetical protein [Xenophilus aerolatus]
MASDLQLLRVVAFNAEGQPVLVPLERWKLQYSERRATLALKCSGYSRTYDLRTELASVAPMDSRKKVSLGKTLGRVALTGLVHGRHGAAADLRWGGLDRDEVVTLMLFFRDTTTVQIDLESDEVQALLEMVPESVASEEAYEAATAVVRRINAMVEDGPRVVGELDAKTSKLADELAALRPKVESGESFDERQAARERWGTIERELAELQSTRVAVVYTLAFQGKDGGTAHAKPSVPLPAAGAGQGGGAAAATSVAPLATVAPAPVSRPAAPIQPAAARPSVRRSGPGMVVKTLVFVLGAFVGCVAALMSMVFFGPWGLILSPVTIIGAGWLAVKMLKNLMSR